MLTHPQVLQFPDTLFSDDPALQAFLIFTEDDGSETDQSLQELRLVDDRIKGYLVELTKCCQAEQFEKGSTDTYGSIRMDARLIADAQKFPFQSLVPFSFHNNLYCKFTTENTKIKLHDYALLPEQFIKCGGEQAAICTSIVTLFRLIEVHA